MIQLARSPSRPAKDFHARFATSARDSRPSLQHVLLMAAPALAEAVRSGARTVFSEARATESAPTGGGGLPFLRCQQLCRDEGGYDGDMKGKAGNKSCMLIPDPCIFFCTAASNRPGYLDEAAFRSHSGLHRPTPSPPDAPPQTRLWTPGMCCPAALLRVLVRIVKQAFGVVMRQEIASESSRILVIPR